MCADRASVTGPRARDLITRARDEALADRPAYTTLLRLLTLGGRVPYPDAVDSLTVKERSVLQQTIGDEELRLLPADPHGPDGSDSRDLLVAYSPQGKLSLLEASEGRPAGVGDVLALLRVSRSVLERAEEEHAAWQVAEDREQARLDRVLRGWEAAGSLPARVRQAADWADHVETVLIYCGRQVFSRSDAGTSTLLRERPLRELAAEPPAAWSPAERLLVMAVHVLFATGRSIRFEEFNGRQLSATALRTWLVSTWHRYAHALGRHIPADLPTRPLLPLAAEVAELARAVDRSDWIRFRRITGTTFGKREVLAMLPQRERSHCPAPDTLAALAERSLGRRHARELPGEELVARMVREAVTGTAAEQVPLLERILATIVESAVQDLDADYAMSSAVRDLRRLGRSGPVRAASPLTLRKPDFFCCVLPHPGRLGGLRDVEIRRILWLVAQRMQYNRWHFVPGNFDRAEVPAERHYFFPPALPDLAESADMWHGGHVAAGVRYSLRAPGAQLWRGSLVAGGNEYRGGYDLRAVRMSGEPFVRADLWLATRYSGLIDAFWRAMAACVPQDPGEPYPVITAFDRHWYENDEWKAFTGRTAAVGSRR